MTRNFIATRILRCIAFIVRCGIIGISTGIGA